MGSEMCIRDRKFAEITPAGKVRHAVFVGLRDDKPADAISLENDSELD